MNTFSIAVAAVTYFSLVVYGVVFGPKRVAAIRTAIANGETNARIKMYRQELLTGWPLAALAVITLVLGGLGWSEVGLGAHIHFTDQTKGLFTSMIGGVIGGAAFLVVAKKRGRPTPVLGDIDVLLPRTKRERWWFAAVAITAGITEEVIYRALPILTLHEVLGTSLVIPAVVSTLVFGFMHRYQGTAGIIATALIGGLLAFLYVATHSLLPAMVVHVAIDLRALSVTPKEPAT